MMKPTKREEEYLKGLRIWEHQIRTEKSTGSPDPADPIYFPEKKTFITAVTADHFFEEDMLNEFVNWLKQKNFKENGKDK